MNLFVASPNEQQANTCDNNDHRGHDDGETVTKRPIVGGASREPRGPARVEVRNAFGLQCHQALTAPGFGEGSAGTAVDSKKQEAEV